MGRWRAAGSWFPPVHPAPSFLVPSVRGKEETRRAVLVLSPIQPKARPSFASSGSHSLFLSLSLLRRVQKPAVVLVSGALSPSLLCCLAVCVYTEADFFFLLGNTRCLVRRDEELLGTPVARCICLCSSEFLSF